MNSESEDNSRTSSTETVQQDQVELTVANKVQIIEIAESSGQNGNVKLTISSKNANTNITFIQNPSLSVHSQSMNEFLPPELKTDVERFGKGPKKFLKGPIFKRKIDSSQPSVGMSASQPIGIEYPDPEKNGVNWFIESKRQKMYVLKYKGIAKRQRAKLLNIKKQLNSLCQILD